MYYLTTDGTYYEGERASTSDIKVPKRPSPYDSFNRQTGKWSPDDNLIMQEKLKLLAIADSNYNAKLLLAADSQKNELQNKYNLTVGRIRNISTPSDIENFKF